MVLDALLPGLALEAVRDLEQSLGRIGAAREHHVLDALAQLGVDVLVDRELARIDDAHAQPGANRVVEEHRCIASRTTSLPRNENDTLLTPPLTSACGQALRICAVASMKSSA